MDFQKVKFCYLLFLKLIFISTCTLLINFYDLY